MVSSAARAKASNEELIEKEVEKLRSIPAGLAKSGRVWKDKSSKFSTRLVLQKSNKTSWAKKMQLKAETKNLKEHEKKVKDDYNMSKRVKNKKKKNLESNRLDMVLTNKKVNNKQQKSRLTKKKAKNVKVKSKIV